ncbi:hypothetical protein N7504_002169 [Penicillium tannophilum]|nr:hypothetical protein N7504_002169 [Penicillium tannophilum]
MQPPTSAPDHKNTKNTPGDTTWTQNILSSIRGFFSNGPADNTEADAVEAWVGVRRGRGRCRSVGEVR